MHRAAVRDGVRIDWQCPRCEDVHSDSFSENTRVETQESFFEVHELQPGSDMSDPIAESTRLETDDSYRDVSGMLPLNLYLHSSYYTVLPLLSGHPPGTLKSGRLVEVGHLKGLGYASLDKKSGED